MHPIERSRRVATFHSTIWNWNTSCSWIMVWIGKINKIAALIIHLPTNSSTHIGSINMVLPKFVLSCKITSPFMRLTGAIKIIFNRVPICLSCLTSKQAWNLVALTFFWQVRLEQTSLMFFRSKKGRDCCFLVCSELD